MLDRLRSRAAELRARRRFAGHEAVGRALYERYGATVRHGPFAGLELPDAAARRFRALGPKLLGTYENVLERYVEAAIADTFAQVLNVGAADGYFAVGLARRMPGASVVAYEAQAAMRSVLEETVRHNGVAERVRVRGACTVGALQADLAERALLVVDCEGAERELLDPAAVPRLAGCSAIVELHDFLDPSISSTLTERFSRTHDLAVVDEGDRPPPELPELRELSARQRALAVDELRPVRMSWLVVAPRGDRGPFAEAVRAQG